MNDTVKAIVGLLDSGRPELQVAAAQILGELRPKEPLVVKALAAAASRSNVLGRFAIEALAHIGTPEALGVVVQVLLENDGLVDQATHLLGEAGTRAHAVIRDVFPSAPPDRRLRMLHVLTRTPTREAVEPFVHALVAPETGAEAVPLVIQAAGRMDAALRKAMTKAISGALHEPLPDAAVAALLRVVAQLDGGAKTLLMQHAGDKSPEVVRQAALEALRGQQLTALQAKAFLQQLEDPKDQALHPALRAVLAEMPKWPEGLSAQLNKFLASRNAELRLFALRAMRSSPTAELVKLALKLRDHDDERFRTAAEEVLAGSKHAIEPVLRLLQLAKDPVEARRLAGILARLGELMPPKQVRAIAERAIKMMPNKPRIADHLIDVALQVGGDKLAPMLVERAIRWRRSRRFAEALHVLAKLAEVELLDDEGRYQLAVTRFLQDAARPGVEDETPGNAAMGFFTVLLREGFPLLQRVKKDSSVHPEHMLKLATYFADTVGPERRFGQELLHHLAQRHKGRTGEEARHALRAVGY